MNTIAVPPLVRTYHVVRPKFDVLYPFVEGVANPHVQYTINERLTSELNRMIAERSASPGTDITGGYEIKSNERGILSILLIVYGYSGGAHGMTVQHSLTFDVTTGRVYPLSGLFKPRSDYVAVLNRAIEDQIKARQLPLISDFTGINPEQTYYIADKALVIYFQLYDLVPYAYGFPYFPISVYDLSGIVREDGPLGRMMA